MRAAWRTIKDAFQDAWGDLWTTLACALFWYVANVLIVTGPPATLALVYYANRMAHGEVVDLGDVWQAFRRYWGPAWRWGLVCLGVAAFLVGDMLLTARNAEGLAGAYLQGFYVALLAGWLLVQLFALPFLFEQDTMSVRNALRNGAVMIGKNLGFALALAVLLALLMIVGTLTFMLSFAFGPVVITAAANHAVISRLAMAKRSAPTPPSPGLK